MKMSVLEYANKELEHITVDGSKNNLSTTLLTLLSFYENSKVFRDGTKDDQDDLIGLFCRLANMQPISKLTGEDNEWEPVCHSDFAYVNKRCDRVVIFADDPDKAYDLDARRFSYDRGKTWIDTPYKIAPIDFPYRVPGQPKRVYLKTWDTPEKWVKRQMKKGLIKG